LAVGSDSQKLFGVFNWFFTGFSIHHITHQIYKVNIIKLYC
jgi:hypothetical protein